MITLVNLTPHNINVYSDSGVTIIYTSNIIARVDMVVTSLDTKAQYITKQGYEREVGVPMFKTVYGEVTNLPEKVKDTLYIVSGIVQTAAGRDDLVVPANLVRDDKGMVVGCKGLSF